MQVQSYEKPNTNIETVFSRLGTWFVILYLGAAALAFIIVPILVYQWMSHPFLGVFVGKNLQINPILFNLSEDWLSNWDNYNSDAVISEINNEKINDISDLNGFLSRSSIRDSVLVTIEDNLGKSTQFQIRLEKLTITDVLSYLIIPFLVGLLSLISGFWVFILRFKDPAGKIFTIFAVSVSLSTALLFDANTTNQLGSLWIFGLSLLGGSFFTLAIKFPEQDSVMQKWSMISWMGFIPSILLFLNAINLQLKLNTPFPYSTQMGLIKFYVVIGFVFYLASMASRLQNTASPRSREQYRYILIGMTISFSIPISWIVLDILKPTIIFSPLILLSLIVFPITSVVSLSRNNLFRIDRMIRQTLVYSIMTFLTAIAYSFLITGIGLIFGSLFVSTNPFLNGIIIFTLALTFLPLRTRLQIYIDKMFDRNKDPYHQVLQTFSHDLTEALDEEKINKLVRSILTDLFSPNRIHIFVNNPGYEHYYALYDENGKPTSDLYFSIESGLVQILTARRTPIFIGDSKSTPSVLLPEITRLGLLGAVIYVPLPGRQRLIGWIAMGSRLTNQPYNQQDINFLETMSDQTALAIERAQAVEDLERRVHQMNVLNRITQGINLTTSYNDILELIYAQSNLVLPTKDFKINLIDKRTGVLTTIFYLENDDRYSDRENQPNNLGLSLEKEVIKLGRPIITQDFDRECRSRGFVSESKGIYGWLGVPLNTGVETIGVLSLGSRDPKIIFTEEQSNLLLAIADQAAGAIVKAGLLEEAERRALQLATLNEVARSLSSTLELIPLLNQILRSAVEILNCTAGNLILIDEETGEYVFEATVGPVSNNLLGTRLPPGTGMLGKVATSRQPIIVNDIHRPKDSFSGDKSESDFSSNDLLIVPMLYRDEVSGVIEIINRNDSLPFTKDDQDLLSAFASQAAVALENARLFTLTDQTLTERVEELSVLQRIDRELNTSLDIERAMRVTLGWALSQSKAEAGLIGMIEENSAQIMASEGYGEELSQYLKNGLTLDFPAIEKAMDTGFPQIIDIKTNDKRKIILSGAQQQVAIPLRRESQTIGLVLLESTSPNATEDEIVGFLNRLGDHASIAITNARLYAEIQEANQAKSDFVSFVSHELKTPMTSIRGFTDLLSSGVVGEVNENQANFLNTIRSNVERMATLVSDLTDVSRIEAGRLRLDFSAIQVSEIVEEVVRSTRAQILEKKQTLILNIPDQIPDMWGDRIRLLQILTNLVSNAYKYTQSEGLIQITAESTDNIWTDGSPRVIHISVHDNGFGISEENQLKIFQKFYRSDDQKVRDAPGTGLGLNITKQLVELQGGHIWFESKFREGTIFHFIIPIAEIA